MNGRVFQRGFNLVEMSIILVIVGLILGAVIIPSQSLYNDDIYKEEERRMEEIKTAILGYAFRHRTIPGVVSIVRVTGRENPLGSGVDDPDRRFNADLRRPYLPCPDITGDGYEDRFTADITGSQFFVAPVRTIVNEIRAYGACHSSRGVLPWRTLGVPPADHWGNLYTYQVDGVFASALSGFNQNSLIDEYDPRQVIFRSGRNDPFYRNRIANVLTLTVAGLTTTDSFRPPIVCGGGECRDGISLNLEAGKQADGDFSILYRSYAQNDIIEGVPFVVVSHGKNGAGAVNYARNVADKISGASAAPSGVICNEPVDGTAGGGAVAFIGPNPEAYNFPHPEPPTADARCRSMTIDGIAVQDGFLFYQPGRSDNFDDVVAWMTREELFDHLRRTGVLDAPDYPVSVPY